MQHLTTAGELETVIGRPPTMVMLKQIGILDDGCREVLARSPVAALGYRDRDGTGRTTFVGGTPGFARVLSPARFSFPCTGDPYGPVSMFFLLPGVGEVLRVNGSAGARRGGSVIVDIKEAYVHCAQAVLRSGLWQPPAPPAPPAGFAGDGPLAGPGVAAFLAAAPFLAVSSWDLDGGSDTSPRGDQQAAARILDGRTLVIPDRRGNKRADTLHNLLHDDRLSLAALVPGRSGVLHVRGRGTITADPALLATMALRGQPPHLALVVDVEHAEVSGNDAVARARLWSPGADLTRGPMPDLLAMAGAHLALNDAAPRFLPKLFGLIPDRLLRRVMNAAYRSGLRKEGYGTVSLPATRPGPAPAGPLREVPPHEVPLREVRVVEVRRETATAVTLVLSDGEPFTFRPGQFFTLVADIDGRPVRRSYSASSAPGSRRLEVTVKQVEGGTFSCHDFRPGDRLAVRGPSGTFHAAEDRDLVLVAAGSGITPMMSMIRAGTAGRIALLYSSRTEQEIIFAGELARLARDHPDRLAVTHVLTRRDGRLTADGVRHWVAGLSATPAAHYYVCGPGALMDTVRDVLTGLGVPAAQVHSERYTGDPAPAATTTVPQELTVEQDGRPLATVLVEPGQTLLDAGLAAGLPMPYGCTVGSCGDCAVRLGSGHVTPAPAGPTVLTCVTCPLSKVTIHLP